MTFFNLPLLLLYFSNVIPLTRKAQFILSIIFTLLVCLISGTRYYSDIDYGPYVDLFSETPSFSYLTMADIVTLYGEPGYLAFTSLIKSFGLDFFAVTLFFSFISIFVKLHVASKFAKEYLLVISLYLCLHFVTVEFIELRWALSSSLVILAIYYELNKRTRLFFICIFAASLFHFFSLFFIMVLFFRLISLKLSLFIFAISFLTALLYKVVGPSIIYPIDSDIYIVRRLFRYLNDPESSVGLFSYLRILMYSIFLLFISFYCEKFSEFEIFLAKFSALLVSSSLLISFVPLLYFRSMVVSDFFAISVMVVFIRKLDFAYRKLITVLISILFCLWNIIDVINYTAAGYIFDYQSWFKFIL